MAMAGHQHVGVDEAAGLLRGNAQGIEVTETIRPGVEAGLAAVAPLDDLPGQAGEVESRFSRHRLP